MFYSVSDIVLMTLQKVLKPRIRPLQKAAKIFFCLVFCKQKAVIEFPEDFPPTAPPLICLNSRLLIAKYSLACSRLRDSWVLELRKREHEKETVAPFSPTNHALIFARALTLRRHPYYLRAWERLHSQTPLYGQFLFYHW